MSIQDVTFVDVFTAMAVISKEVARVTVTQVAAISVEAELLTVGAVHCALIGVCTSGVVGGSV